MPGGSPVIKRPPWVLDNSVVSLVCIYYLSTYVLFIRENRKAQSIVLDFDQTQYSIVIQIFF